MLDTEAFGLCLCFDRVGVASDPLRANPRFSLALKLLPTCQFLLAAALEFGLPRPLCFPFAVLPIPLLACSAFGFGKGRQPNDDRVQHVFQSLSLTFCPGFPSTLAAPVVDAEAQEAGRLVVPLGHRRR